ncbi:uncharacterized protein LOC111808715 [Cucurbita pepo subsp. pepo]|uniref:uncharacterized protein LOC111785350 n=1 Tax=Cucurbita pepo subsp. pepo TaxID=3664 RepID=UPI000C9D9291|nr:uncharacterized protein LOC111785350 [Cucurbita pepo subsp. pepo]XP_023522109.1 uncharacterized protein LOC111785985 [Cucurbita pepo subsp. pepo]XP_023550633.1 uncharacterized protein LOC111808715 [Cucurbita pepo subsp. pepo]
MGNYISCSLATPLIKNFKAVRVVLPGGEVRQFRESVNAAELMLECPTHFLANAQSLHIGRRFSALAADEELEFGNVYLMFPMKRVNSVVTAADLATFFMAANSAARRISAAKVRVIHENRNRESGESEAESRPRISDENNGPRLSLEGIEGFPMHRLSVCRSRKPLLETIKEEHIRGR